MATSPSGLQATASIYEPLDLTASRPSIRLAILGPGKQESLLRVKLRKTTFADKPKYEALSYTWGRPDLVKEIELNGRLVKVRENLWSALVYLRHTEMERVLWIDAICINQNDLEERNHQVKHMAFIYSRAVEVLVWLGLVDSEALEVQKLCSHPYWERVWIVQEIGAARKLTIHWASKVSGSKCTPWDKFFDQIRQAPPSITHTERPMRLANQRQDRYGNSYLLANLMESCQDSVCEEPHDKVYGFVGIAHDCQDNSITVDYSKSLYELYEDVIRLQYRPTGISPRRIVHFSQLVQRMLGGIVEVPPDIFERKLSLPESWSDSFTQTTLVCCVEGTCEGTISILGPCYGDIIGIPETTREWRYTLSDRENAEELREKYDGLIDVLLELERSDLEKIVSCQSQFMWPGAVIDRHQPRRLDEQWIRSHTFPFEFSFKPRTESDSLQEPRVFLCGDNLMGLGPFNAIRGDYIIRFRNSDVVLVLRDDRSSIRIVGSARIVRLKSKKCPQLDTSDDYSEGSMTFSSQLPSYRYFETGPNVDLDTSIYIDIYTLQLLTQ